MNVELPETLVIIESIVYKSNGFAIVSFPFTGDIETYYWSGFSDPHSLKIQRCSGYYS
jgi:hypothetical protein